MNRHGATQRIFAACLILSLHAFLVPSFAGTATSSLTGRVVSLQGRTRPIGTGKIHVGNPGPDRLPRPTCPGKGPSP
jgi:hypothetical protein